MSDNKDLKRSISRVAATPMTSEEIDLVSGGYEAEAEFAPVKTWYGTNVGPNGDREYTFDY